MTRVLLLALLLALPVASLAATYNLDAVSPPGLRPEHLTTATAWGDRQFLQGDSKGRLFLLHAGTLEVFPFAADGTLGEPERLEDLGDPLAGPAGGPLIRGVMSPDGDWLLVQGYKVRLFRGGKEQSLGAPRSVVFDAGFLNGDPMIGGKALSLSSNAVLKKDAPPNTPVLSRWEGDAWESFFVEDLGEEAKTRPASLREQYSARLLGTPDGRLWAAYEYRPLLREYSPGGRILTEVVIGSGQPEAQSNARELEKAAAEEGAELSRSLGKQVAVQVITAKSVARGLAGGFDGKIYVLVADGAGVALDRYDPVALQVDRLPLRIPDLWHVTMASGKDGLYIAGIKANMGIWKLSWDRLEAAEWIPVTNAAVRTSEGMDLEGAWREKGGQGLVRFDKDRVISFEKGRLTVRGMVKLAGNEALLRRSGFAETWKIARQQDVLRIEREGKAREYLRLKKIPVEVSLTPFAFGEAKKLPPERVQAIQAEFADRALRARKARREPEEKRDAQAVDAENLAWLRELTAEVGWIDTRRFGVKAAGDAAALARFGLDIPLLLAALPLVEKDLKISPEGAEEFSLFHDTLQVALGGKQKYGTQIEPAAVGGPVVLPLVSRAGVDGVRRAIGLSPLAEYLQRVSADLFAGKPVQVAAGEVVEPLPARPSKAEAVAPRP